MRLLLQTKARGLVAGLVQTPSYYIYIVPPTEKRCTYSKMHALCTPRGEHLRDVCGDQVSKRTEPSGLQFRRGTTNPNQEVEQPDGRWRNVPPRSSDINMSGTTVGELFDNEKALAARLG